MNITTQIIITDTNIITDLNNAKVLDKFVKLNNVYISDMIKHDEINHNTGDINIISKFKIIRSNSNQLLEVNKLTQMVKGLTGYDLLNYVIARDNNAILATGDNKLKNYSEKHGVQIIRTLKIIQLMKENNVLSSEEAINACKLLKEHNKTRIPATDIDNIIKLLEEDLTRM